MSIQEHPVQDIQVPRVTYVVVSISLCLQLPIRPCCLRDGNQCSMSITPVCQIYLPVPFPWTLIEYGDYYLECLRSRVKYGMCRERYILTGTFLAPVRSAIGT
jgi:hypothetical protein